MKKMLRLFSVAMALALPFAAQGQVLNFEGIVPAGVSYVELGDWYNGGGGPNYGISFSSNALALCLASETPGPGCIPNNTSRGGLGDPSSQWGGLFFLGGTETYMNRAAGFTDGFSFFYTSPFNTGGFSVWSGMDGTGTLLATMVLTPTTDGSGLPNCSSTNFCPYNPIGVAFLGTAMSVSFEGVADQIAFDDVTFGSAVPGEVVPEPASMALLATGLIGVYGVARRRRKSA